MLPMDQPGPPETPAAPININAQTQEAQILPSVPMAAHLAQVAATQRVQARWEREIAVVNVMKGQLGQCHALIAEKEVDLQYCQLRIAELEAIVKDLQIKLAKEGGA